MCLGLKGKEGKKNKQNKRDTREMEMEKGYIIFLILHINSENPSYTFISHMTATRDDDPKLYDSTFFSYSLYIIKGA